MPAAAFDVLADMAEAVLAAAVEGITADGAELPDRRFVHGGPGSTVAWDCPLLSVNLESLAPQSEGKFSPKLGASPLVATYMTQVVICYPTVDRGGATIVVPPAAEESAAARELYGAAFAARRGVLDRVTAKTLDALQTDAPLDRRGIGYDLKGEVGALTPNPRSPSGGMAAMWFPTRIRI